MNHGDGGEMSLDGYDDDDIGDSNNNNGSDDFPILLLIKVLEVWLGLSVVFFIVATIRFYVALYYLGMNTDGFQPTLQHVRHWIVTKWFHGKRLLN